MKVGRAVQVRTAGGVLLAMLFIVRSVGAQLPGTRVPGGCDVPVSKRSSEFGCYLTATQAIEKLPGEAIFWHIDTYPTRALADPRRRLDANSGVPEPVVKRCAGSKSVSARCLSTQVRAR
jgi:hypothetical protein